MAWDRMLNSLRSFNSKLPSKSAIGSSFLNKIHQHHVSPSFSERIVKRPGYQLRRYSTDPSSGNQFLGTIRSRNSFFMVVLCGSSLGVAVCMGQFDTVPYSNRKIFVIPYTNIEKWLEEVDVRKLRREHNGEILSQTSVHCLRVKRILENIIEAFQKDLTPEATRRKNDEIPGFEWRVLVINHSSASAQCFSSGLIVINTELLLRLDRDDTLAFVIAHQVSHIISQHIAEKRTWNVWFYMSVAMIVPPLMKAFEHSWAVAKAWLMSSSFGIFVLELLGQYFNYELVEKTTFLVLQYLFDFHMSVRHVLEADYIGLLLMAAAGYDPRAAVEALGGNCKFDLSESNSCPRVIPCGCHEQQPNVISFQNMPVTKAYT